jgi:hypothetical protein
MVDIAERAQRDEVRPKGMSLSEIATMDDEEW